MIVYVDTFPEVAEHNGHFILTLTSGSERSQFMLTRHVLMAIERHCSQAVAKACIADMERETIPFPAKARGKKGAGR